MEHIQEIYIYIYVEYIRNIHEYLWYKESAAIGGRSIGSVFLIILYHKYLCIFLIHSLYIPFIFPRYVPCIFPCVFLNLWSQQKTSPYRKTTFIFFSGLYAFYMFINNFMIFIKINDFENKIVSFGAGGTAGREPGEPGRTFHSTCSLSHCIRTLRVGAHMGPILFKKSLILIKSHRIVNQNIKGVKFEKIKVKTLFCDKDLSSYCLVKPMIL